MTRSNLPPMKSDERRWAAARWLGAIALWTGLGFSLGWYYTFTYYGHAGWPMPMVEVCAAIILYYFSVLNAATEIQAIHWMCVFPVAGALWAGEVWHLALYFGRKRPQLSRWLLDMSLSAVPVAIAGPAMTLVAGKTDAGFSGQRMIDVALRHGFVDPPGWLSPLYFALGLLGLGWQVYAYQRHFPGPVFRGLIHTLVAALLTILAACVIGATLSVPLRSILE